MSLWLVIDDIVNSTEFINQDVIGCVDIVNKMDLINQFVIGCGDIVKKQI